MLKIKSKGNRVLVVRINETQYQYQNNKNETAKG